MEIHDDIALDAIQGNITPGFHKDFQELLFVRFPDQKSGLAWAASVYPHLTSAREVATYNQLYRQLRHPPELASVAGWNPPLRPDRSADDLRTLLRSTWLNVAFTAQGLKLLGVNLDTFPKAFTEGLFQRTTTPLDQFTYGPKNEWRVRDSNRSGAAAADAGDLTHAVLVVGADTATDLAVALTRQYQQLALHRVDLIASDSGQTLGDGRIHFGFRDGLSQPDPRDLLLKNWATWEAEAENDQIVKPGEFILGCPNERNTQPDEPEWARHGSYLVFLKLRQNVKQFQEEMRDTAEKLTASGIETSAELLTAQVAGRWPSGAKLKPGDTKDPSPGARPCRDAVQITNEDFRTDPYGDVCPLFAHVRRANPRGEQKEADGTSALTIRQHRIIRRGIPYGPPLADELAGADTDRGLLFLSYQASIERQFEHVMKSWINYDGFPLRQFAVGYDGLLGFASQKHEDPATTADAAYHRSGEGGAYEDFVLLKLARHVQAMGGGYFFTPSIPAVAALAAQQTQPQSIMRGHMERNLTTTVTTPPEPDAAPGNLNAGSEGTYAQLARLIQDQLPYSERTTLPRLQGADIWDLDDRDAKKKILAPRYPDNQVVRRQGLHKENTPANPNVFKPNEKFRPEEQAQLIPIYLPDSDGTRILYECTKVLRIWYTYTTIDPETHQDREVGTFLIVGYVGNGQP